MTANPFAALLAGVPRCHTPDGTYLHQDAVLAALAAAVTADLAEAGKVLEGVTPGPWETVFDRQTWGWLEVDGPSFKIGAPTRATDLSLADEVQRKKDARFIAWCREGVPALLARLAAQEANIGEQGRLVRDLTKRARDAEEQRDQNRDTAIEFETALAAMTKERDEALHFLDVAVDKSPEPLKKLGKHLASLLDEDDWPTAERLLNGAATALAAERAKTAKLVEALVTAREWVYGCTRTGINQDLAEADLATIDTAITEAGQ